MGKKDFFTLNLNKISLAIKEKDYLTQDNLFEVLKVLKKKSLVSKSLSFNNFLLRLIDEGLNQFSINIRGHSKVRYTMNKTFDIYSFCNTLERNGYFPMTTSLNIQNLSNYRNDYIFITKERTVRADFYDIKLKQEDIDRAFSKKPRRTNAHDKIEGYRVVMLETNNTSAYEIVDFNGVKVSSVNRTFVEIISNIHYFQSSNKVIELFKQMEIRLDIDIIYSVIEKFDFIYPYFQLAGFYLERIGYKREQLKQFYTKKTDLKFYTEKNKEKYSFDEYWNIYY